MAIDSFLQNSLNFAKNQLLNVGHLSTMIVGETPEGKRTAFVGIFRNSEEKEAYLQMVSMAFLFLGVHRYISLSEAWMSIQKPDAKKMIQPSKDPHRKECLIAILVSYSNAEGIIYEIKRKNKQITDLEQMEKMDGIAGTFTELLPPRNIKIPERFKPIIKNFINTEGKTFH